MRIVGCCILERSLGQRYIVVHRYIQAFVGNNIICPLYRNKVSYRIVMIQDKDSVQNIKAKLFNKLIVF